MQALDSREGVHSDNGTDEADAPSESEKSEPCNKAQDDERSKCSASDSDEGPDELSPSIDEQMEKIGFGHFHKRCLLMFCFIMTSRGAEYVFFQILPTYAIEQWKLDMKDYDIHTWISFVFFCIGMVMGGALSDKYGRHVVLLAVCVGFSVSTMCRAVSPDWHMFCAMHFASEFCAGCEFPIILALAHEFFPRKWRSESVLLLIGSGLFFGVLYISIINNFIVFAFDSSMPNNWWRVLVAVSVIPHLLSTAMLWSDTPESPRWLLTKGRKQMCSSLLKLIADENNTESQLLADGDVRIRKIVSYDISVLDVMGSLCILRVWMLSTVFMAASLVISLWVLRFFSVDSLNSATFWDKNALVPMLQPIVIALSMFMSKMVGPRSSIMFAYGVSFFLSLVTTLFPSTVMVKDGLNRLHLCFLFVSGCQTLALAVASFPTAFRSTLLGLSCCCALVFAGGACRILADNMIRWSFLSCAVISLFEAALSALIVQVPEEIWMKASEDWPD